MDAESEERKEKVMIMDDVEKAMLGDREAQQRLTEKGLRG